VSSEQDAAPYKYSYRRQVYPHHGDNSASSFIPYALNARALASEYELERGSSRILPQDRLFYTADDEHERDPYSFTVGPSSFEGGAVGGPDGTPSASTSFSKPCTPQDKCLYTSAADDTEYHPYGFTMASSDAHGPLSLDSGTAGSADSTPSSSASISRDDYLPSAVGTEDHDQDSPFRMFGIGEDWTMGMVELSP
jgi:hypothetical protein